MIERAAICESEDAVVFVIDDDRSVRDSLKDLLESVGLRVQAFASPQEFLHSERWDAPACLVLDVRMPGMGGLEFQREMAMRNMRLPIVFITAHGDIPMSVQAMKAGAIDFLTKPFREQSLLDAIQRGIEANRVQRSEETSLAELHQRFTELTTGEREVMALVVSGLLNKQIASQLGVSEITVKVRRANVMHKMKAQSLPDLVRLADRLKALKA